VSTLLKTEKIKKKYTDYMFDHTGVRLVLDNVFATIICILSALIYAFGFRAFIAPLVVIDGETVTSFVSGGASGLSQNIVLIIKIVFGDQGWTPDTSYTLQSILYFVLNIPIFILGYKGVGKRFAIFSFLNVIFVSLFIKFLPSIAIEEILKDNLGRALFAGICTGISSAIAYKAEISAGGLDVISYYFAYHKSTSVGKYSIAFNTVIVILYTLLSYIYSPIDGWSVLTITLYTIVYFFTSALVVDALNTRNKKAELQIITSKPTLPKIILANFPHSCTVVPAKGGFSNEDRLIIYIVVSSFEVKKLVKLVRTVDHDAFINVSNSSQVFGKFFIKPVK
jgi:uncharacterized membrane-anchored protein YitT (DUF2179 family)